MKAEKVHLLIALQLVSLTAHWVQDNFVRASAALHMEVSHTGVLIAEKLEDMLSHRKSSKESGHLVLRDKAFNMKREMLWLAWVLCR